MDVLPGAISATRTGPGAADVPSCTERLLLTEQRDLIPLLRSAPAESFGRPTECPGWTVRDVLAHCSAALTRITLDQIHDFSPACNQQDVADRNDWSISQIIDELDRGYETAGPVIAAAEGRLDVIALGEWIHAGDVRAAFGLMPSYAVAGTEDALDLLAVCSAQRNTPLLVAHLPDRDLELGTWLPDQRYVADLIADAETLIRLYTGRSVVGLPLALSGATESQLAIYR